jgi:hypothetical protein
LTHIGGRNKSRQPLPVHEFVLVFCIGLHFVSIDRHSLWFDCYGWHHKEEQQQFWVDITNMNGQQAANAADVLVTSHDEKKEFYSDAGDYLPLGVWATRGYDPNHIKTRSRDSDVIEDPVLGTVYRVRILSKGNSGSRATVVTRNLKRKSPLEAIGNGAGSSGDHLGSGGSGAGSSGDHLAIGNANPPPSPSGSSSATTSDDSSNSSIDSDKKKKKSKKHKKGKKSKKSKKNKKDKKEKKEKKQELAAIKDLSCTTVNLAACRFLLFSHHS